MSQYNVGYLSPIPTSASTYQPVNKLQGKKDQEPKTVNEAIRQRLTRPWSFKDGSLGSDILNGALVTWSVWMLLAPQYKKWALPAGILSALASTAGGVINTVTKFQSEQKEKQNPPKTKAEAIQRMLTRPATILTVAGIVLGDLMMDVFQKQVVKKELFDKQKVAHFNARFGIDIEQAIRNISTRQMIMYSLAFVPLYLAYKTYEASKRFDEKKFST